MNVELASVVSIDRQVQTVEPLPRLAFTRSEAAIVMGVSVQTLDRLIRSGELKARRSQHGRVVLIGRQAILDYLAGGGDAA
jgi:excisionase family DNA binding protein